MNNKKQKTVLGPDSPTHKKFLDCKSNYIIFGGGAGCGKSHQALLLVLKYKDDPNFRAVFIRETSTQLSQAGGLYQEAEKMWKQFGAKFKTHPQMTAVFPSGAQVQFKVCGADRDISNYDGGQFSLVVFDEAQNHTDVQIRYLESRIRSQAKGPHQLIATCNPRRDSHLMPFVNWYLDQDTGIPIPERSGVERYYASYNGTMVFADTKEELIETYPGVRPQSYTFISATIRDNPRMKVLNPGYVARLENLKRVERERLLLGSWFAKEESSGYFKRDWCEIVDKVPALVSNRARGMDLASTLKSESNPNPDWTASTRISKGKDGFYYVEHVERYRKLTHGVLEEIAKCAIKDRDELGQQVPVFIPKDPGAGGAAANMFFIKTLVENGVDARTEMVSGHTGKLSRMQPFLSLAEAGLVRVVRGEWNEMWFNELEDYIDGNRNQKDDMWDSTATACKAVMKQITIPSFTLSVNTQPSPIPSV
jgi:predicted phage terminase large subunit-like protein